LSNQAAELKRDLQDSDYYVDAVEGDGDL